MFGVPTQRSLQVGVYLATDGIAIAEVNLSAEPRPTLHSCHFIETDQPEERLAQLGRYVREHALKRSACVVVLDESSYNLIQMSAPPVQDDELAAALRWSVKDLIDYPIDDGVIDVFRVPVQEHREAKVYAVVAPRGEIQQAVDFIRKAGLRIESIDIEQLSIGNIVEQLEGQEKGIAVLHIDREHGSINLYQNSALYLSRKIDTGLARFEALQAQGVDMQNNAESIYEPIILELQRSLDFYEHQFAKPSIRRLLVAPRHPLLQSFCDYASSSTGLQVEFLNLGQVYPDSTALDDQGQTNCLLAIAAASRLPVS
jgi:MSHA biogenesis protein MshI